MRRAVLVHLELASIEHVITIVVVMVGVGVGEKLIVQTVVSHSITCIWQMIHATCGRIDLTLASERVALEPGGRYGGPIRWFFHSS